MTGFQFSSSCSGDRDEKIGPILFAEEYQLPSLGTTPSTSSPGPSLTGLSERKRSRFPSLISDRDNRSALLHSYCSPSIGLAKAGSQTIPRRSDVKVTPYNKDTHARDREEFSLHKSEPAITTSNNVAGEYVNFLGSFSTPKQHKIFDNFDKRRRERNSLFCQTQPAFSQSKESLSRLGIQTQRRKFRLKKDCPATSSRSLQKSISDGVRVFTPEANKLSQTMPARSDSIPTPSLVVKRRCGETFENPVELSDDDEVEIEELAVDELWREMKTDFAIGQIWFGKCRLMCHGPSRLRLDLKAISEKKNLTIEFTPYIVEVIPLPHIVSTKLYTRLSGGCTFVSILISECHEWGRWSLSYKFRHEQSDPVWITMFFGASDQRILLERMSSELPSFEEVVCPSDHLDMVKSDLTDQYPCKTSSLDLDSKIIRRKARKQIICNYPPGSRDCVTITNGDLESLDPQEFLNDTVIDFKLAHLRANELPTAHSYHVFSSFFYKRFVTSNMSYDSVKRWTDKMDLFQKDFWLIPICESLHWTLAVVCYPNSVRSDERSPLMLYYDSLGGSGRRAFEVIRRYVAAAAQQPKKLRPVDSVLKIESEFQLIDVRVPRQTNSYDCGIYLLLFAEYFMKHPPADVLSPHRPEWFSRSVADSHRNKLRSEILQIAYNQSPGHPGPVSAEYVKVPIHASD